MKKIITILIVGCLTVHCQPPPERPKKDHHLRLENLIYSVALSSFQLAYQMDAKRKEHVLQQVKKQLEQERENSTIARKALEERVAALIEEKNQFALGHDTSENGMTLQIQEIGPVEFAEESVPAESLALEEKLAQLETLIFGEEGSAGLLFRVKFLTEKWALFDNSPPLSISETVLESSTTELIDPPAPKSSDEVDSEEQVKDLFHFIQGEGHSPGAHSRVISLEEALSFISTTEDQDKTLIETAEQFVKEQKDSVFEGASTEDRLARLERLIHGSGEWEGIISWVEHLQTQVAGLNETSTDDPAPAAAQIGDNGSKG